MKTKAEILLKRMTLMYENIYNLLDAFQAASTINNSDVKVTLKNEDGSSKEVTVNSFQQLQQELNRIDNNFKSLTSKPSYVLESDGTISKYEKTTFLNAEYLENFVFDGNHCVVEKNSVIEDLIFPTVKLPIQINSDFIKSDIYCKIYNITYGFDKIPDNPKELNIEYLYNNGSLNYTELQRTLKLEKQKINYFGRFNVENVEFDKKLTNVFVVTLNSIKYTSKSTIGDNIDLKVGDFLISASGASKYQITDIDKFHKRLTLLRVGGIEIPKVSINGLMFNQVVPTDVNVVNIPIRPSQKLVVFLSTENDNVISYPSVGIKIDTTDFEVIHNETTYTIDEYFQKFVTNFSEYLSSLLNDTTIPYSLGIKPQTPVLKPFNFKVIQINKHLIDAKTQSQMTDLNKKKQQIQNEIDYKQTLIDQTQNEIDSLKYKSIEEKNYRLNSIVKLRNEINTLKQNLLTVTRDIDTNATKYGLKDTKPKFKVIGFWDMQEPMYSPLTTTQHIIKYEVQYRYLSKDVDTTDSTTYRMISNGKEVTVAFSNWVDLPTRTLNKVTDVNGNLKWEEPLLDSVDDININQCSISINESESIEIKVRAVTEAGYPVAPVKSDWSESLRIDFPEDLKVNNLQATVSQNNIDLNKAEFNAILQNLGLLSHISGTIKESEKTFYHNAKDIASGQYTPEQKNIPLDVCIKNILNEINVLKQTKDVNQNIVISFVDFDNESYVITNNSTIEVSAGVYTDEYNSFDPKTWGTIIRKKGYIKIRNNNSIPVEFKTLVPGMTFDPNTAPNYYDVPVLFNNGLTQNTKQILYFRNVDLIGENTVNKDEFKLVNDIDLTREQLFPPEEWTDKNINTEDCNLVGFNNDNIESFKYQKPDSQTALELPFLCFTTEHPLYDNGNNGPLKDDFIRLGNKDSNVKAIQWQQKNIGINSFGFSETDLYAVGRYSCGAYLYAQLATTSKIEVIGNSAIATNILAQESEILIPIIFEYRMSDRLNNIDGVADWNQSDLTYWKKIGIDMLINNSVFKFDIKVSAKLKSKITTIDTKSINSIVGQYNGESKEILS